MTAQGSYSAILGHNLVVAKTGAAAGRCDREVRKSALFAASEAIARPFLGRSAEGRRVPFRPSMAALGGRLRVRFPRVIFA